MEYSNVGLFVTKRFEGCKLMAYQDVGGVWTIGYGHTGVDVKAGRSIAQSEADALLALDIQKACACVNHGVSVELTQGQFDALCDFVFNVGCTKFLKSTMLRYINGKAFDKAAEEFEKWSHAGGNVIAGLLRRRQAEKVEFKS